MLQSTSLVKLPKWRGKLFRIFFKFVVCLQRFNVSNYRGCAMEDKWAVATKNSFLLTKREGCTEDYWPKIVVIRSERSEVRTKKVRGPIFPDTAQASDVTKHFIMVFRKTSLILIFRLSRTKIYGLWPLPWKWSVWQNPDRVRTNQNAQMYHR